MRIQDPLSENLGTLVKQSQEFPRRRALKSFHEANYPGSQVLLNIIQPDSYTRPHCRFYTDESIIHRSGILCSIHFSEGGEVYDAKIISEGSEYMFLPKNTIHTMVSLEENSSFWMIVQGPHDSEII